MVNTVTGRCPDPLAAKQAQMITPPPLCMTVKCICAADIMHFGQMIWTDLSKGQCARSLVVCLDVTHEAVPSCKPSKHNINLNM